MPTRPESEMLALIVGTAREDPRIRAVLLGGSSVEPNAAPDPFRDYDITYFVTELAPFVDDPTWIDRFGPRMIVQAPKAMGDPPPMRDGHFAYLMPFADGNRIDLSLSPLAMLPDGKAEGLTAAPPDQDALFPDLPPPSARAFLPTPPTSRRRWPRWRRASAVRASTTTRRGCGRAAPTCACCTRMQKRSTDERAGRSGTRERHRLAGRLRKA